MGATEDNGLSALTLTSAPVWDDIAEESMFPREMTGVRCCAGEDSGAHVRNSFLNIPPEDIYCDETCESVGCLPGGSRHDTIVHATISKDHMFHCTHEERVGSVLGASSSASAEGPRRPAAACTRLPDPVPPGAEENKTSHAFAKRPGGDT